MSDETHAVSRIETAFSELRFAVSWIDSRSQRIAVTTTTTESGKRLERVWNSLMMSTSDSQCPGIMCLAKRLVVVFESVDCSGGEQVGFERFVLGGGPKASKSKSYSVLQGNLTL